jgi:hypothetical protein
MVPDHLGDGSLIELLGPRLRNSEFSSFGSLRVKKKALILGYFA